MKLPYIKIKQKSEEFFVMKFKANLLKDKVDFSFRDPYSNTPKERLSCDQYINAIERRGIQVSAEQEGVQRRIQLKRIATIKDYLENKKDSYFPNAVVLAADATGEDLFMENVLENSSLPDWGEMDIPDSITFQVVDGQHRLAGLFTSNNYVQDNFEIIAVVLFNATISTCAKVFRDINGTQVAINKSGLFDLLEIIEPDDDNDLEFDKDLHTLCKKFNDDPNSPLFNHIKMLGVGNGAISQAFFITNVKNAIKKGLFSGMQDIYNTLFIYYSVFQRIFPDFWPVISERQFQAGFIDKEFLKLSDYSSMDFWEIQERYSIYILKDKRSQLLKTNGFGAIMRILPQVYNKVDIHSFTECYSYLSVLRGEIDWCKDPALTSGTGAKNVQQISDKMLHVLNIL